jgi:hypothetical protein
MNLEEMERHCTESINGNVHDTLHSYSIISTSSNGEPEWSNGSSRNGSQYSSESTALHEHTYEYVIR